MMRYLIPFFYWIALSGCVGRFRGGPMGCGGAILGIVLLAAIVIALVKLLKR